MATPSSSSSSSSRSSSLSPTSPITTYALKETSLKVQIIVASLLLALLAFGVGASIENIDVAVKGAYTAYAFSGVFALTALISGIIYLRPLERTSANLASPPRPAPSTSLSSVPAKRVTTASGDVRIEGGTSPSRSLTAAESSVEDSKRSGDERLTEKRGRARRDDGKEEKRECVSIQDTIHKLGIKGLPPTGNVQLDIIISGEKITFNFNLEDPNVNTLTEHIRAYVNIGASTHFAVIYSLNSSMAVKDSVTITETDPVNPFLKAMFTSISVAAALANTIS